MSSFIRVRLLLTACAVLTFNVVCAQELTDQNKEEAIKLVNNLLDKAKIVPQDVYQKLAVANNTYASNFSEEQLEKLLKGALNVVVPNTKDNQEMRSTLAAMQSALAKKLQSYRVTGFSFAIDPNGAFFVDNQDPEFTVAYKDARGELRTRRYAASIDSIGLKVEFAINFDFIFLTGTATNFYDTDKVIELGTGFEISMWPLGTALNLMMREPDPADPREHIIPGYIQTISYVLSCCAVTYVPFKNMSGGMIILHGLFGLPGGGPSIITGGTLTPLV